METEATGGALRLERQLANLRWLVAVFGAVQVGFAIRDRGNDPRFALSARMRISASRLPKLSLSTGATWAGSCSKACASASSSRAVCRSSS